MTASTNKMTICQALHQMQTAINCPKNRYNKFGGYKYRAAEDIMVAAKSVLPEGFCLTVSDMPEMIGGRVYIRSTATLACHETSISNTSYAREPDSKKGMDESQLTGSASSYARKYALAGLFCLDDEKDADETNNHGRTSDTAPDSAQTPDDKGNNVKSKPNSKQDDVYEPSFTMLNVADNSVLTLPLNKWLQAYERGIIKFGKKFEDANMPHAALVCQYKPEMEARINGIIARVAAGAA